MARGQNSGVASAEPAKSVSNKSVTVKPVFGPGARQVVLTPVERMRRALRLSGEATDEQVLTEAATALEAVV